MSGHAIPLYIFILSNLYTQRGPWPRVACSANWASWGGPTMPPSLSLNTGMPHDLFPLLTCPTFLTHQSGHTIWDQQLLLPPHHHQHTWHISGFFFRHLVFSPSWEQTQEFKPYLQEIILTDNSVSWSISKGHITFGSNKSAILLSTFSSSPFAYVDPLHCNMAYLYLELLKDSLNEYAYAAELAGLSYDLQNTIYGMYVSTHVLEPSTHQHFLYWFDGSVFDWGYEFNFILKNIYG